VSSEECRRTATSRPSSLITLFTINSTPPSSYITTVCGAFTFARYLTYSLLQPVTYRLQLGCAFRDQSSPPGIRAATTLFAASRLPASIIPLFL
jgi:hypothetical protein